MFHRLVSVDEALELVYNSLREAGHPEVLETDLWGSLGKILAEDIYSSIDYPPFDRSTVEGYAVRALDVAGASEVEPRVLRVVGEVGVGEAPSIEVREGEAVEIATGAIVPRGADAVVMSEYTKREGDRVYIYRHVYPGENISQTGSDISAGDLVLRRGTLLTSREVAALAAIGRRRVRVYRPLRVYVYSTGNEIVEPGQPLRPGAVYDINGYSVSSALREIGLEVYFRGILGDDYSLMREEFEKALRESDVVISTGGTSAGYRDLVYRVLREMGASIVFHGIKSRPGRPTLLAVRDRKVFIGLPGFPLSAMIILLRVVRPAVLRLYGLEERRRAVRVRIPYRVEAGRGVREFIPVSVIETERGYTGYPIQLGSGSVMSLLVSDGFIEVPEDREYIEEDEEVEAVLFSDKITTPPLYFIGSHCLGVEIILRLSGLQNARTLYIGSLGGWHSVKRGEADIAGTHLLDEETGEYNVHMIKKMGLERQVYMVRGYARRIGLVVRRGNPKKIRSLEDLLREDVVFINRNKGSGIRSYTDMMIRRILGGEDPYKRVRGYSYEVKTHTAVAAAVYMGKADVGIAVEAVTQYYDLDFIPLAEEIYDFVIPRSRFEKRSVKRFIEVLQSREFREEISRSLRGYRALEETGEIIHDPGSL